MPIGCVAAFGMGLRTTAIISLHKINYLGQASSSKGSVYLNYIFHVPMNFTSNWNKLSADKFPYIHNLTAFVRLVQMSLQISPTKLVIYQIKFSRMTLPILLTYVCIIFPDG
jgi:hypothetical protein